MLVNVFGLKILSLIKDNDSKMSKVYLFLADGFEVIEAFTPIDVLKRGGVDVVTVSLSEDRSVTSSHNIVTASADITVSEVKDDADVIILPGGYPGYENLGKSAKLLDIICRYESNGKLIAAICGAPTVLARAGVAKNVRVTCHQSVVELMEGYNLYRDEVVSDRNFITARGAGLSLPFALEILSRLVDKETLQRVKNSMEL